METSTTGLIANTPDKLLAIIAMVTEANRAAAAKRFDFSRLSRYSQGYYPTCRLVARLSYEVMQRSLGLSLLNLDSSGHYLVVTPYAHDLYFQANDDTEAFNCCAALVEALSRTTLVANNPYRTQLLCC